MEKHPNQEFKPEAWLWKVSIVILSLGLITAYFLYQQKMNQSYQQGARLVLVFTIIASGICAIVARSRSWIHR